MGLACRCPRSAPGAQATGEAIGESPAVMRTAFKNIRATQTVLVSLAHHQYIFFIKALVHSLLDGIGITKQLTCR